MSKGWTRCEFVSPSSGLECEIWIEGAERQYDSKNQMIPIYCEHHQTASVETAKETFIDAQNKVREYAYEFFKDGETEEAFNKINAHIASIEAEIEHQKMKLFTVRAVRQEKLENLSESERVERMKYVGKNPEKKTETKKADPLTKITKHSEAVVKGSMTTAQARDLLTMDPDEYIKQLQARKAAKLQQSQEKKS